jgi:transcriptional regulator
MAMYIPKHFKVTDENEVFSFIQENAFGQLISNVSGRLFSTHMPFMLSENNTKIVGHLAAQNPQHSELDGQEVLITLLGAHDYISPSWYSAPGVPTWNYQSVHIYGYGKLITEAERIRTLVDTLTDKYESAFSHPWLPEYKTNILNTIVGLEISISEIQCKYKLSQNRSAQDRLQVIAQLKELGSEELAKAMERNEI